MKTVRVAAAILCDDPERPAQVFATARGYGEYRGLWEFPGGKLEPGESAAEALIREIREELNVTIRVDRLLHTIEYEYPGFHLSMDCFFCTLTGGQIDLKEAEAGRWLTRDTLDSVRWLPADETMLDKLRGQMHA